MKPDLDELISYLRPWIRDRVMRERSATAEPGWDGRSPAVDDDTWRDAVRVLLRLGPIFTAQPRIAPCPDGSVHMSWHNPAVAPGDVDHRAAREFLVETRDERFVWTAKVNGEVAAEGECPDLTQLHRLAVQRRCPVSTVPHDGGMSTPRTVTITTTKTITLGQIAYEASDPAENRAHWHNLTDERRAKWERIAEAVAKALESPANAPPPHQLENR